MSDAMTPPDQYCLRWNNHRTNLLEVFGELLQLEAFTDVCLVPDDDQLNNYPLMKCHKIVLAACSPYFRKLFDTLPFSSETIIFLKGVKYTELKAILEYMYHGEVNVQHDQMQSLFNTAQMLKVKGLTKFEDNGESYSDSNDFRRPEDMMETASLSPPPVISTSTNANSVPAHSSSHVSPPPTYGSLYGKPLRPASEINNQIQNSLFWLGLPSLHGINTHQLSPHSSPVAGSSSGPSGSGGVACAGSSSSYDNGYEMTTLHKRKKSMHSSLLNHDTPILRTVLGQSHADSSMTSVPLLQSNNHESMHFRASSNSSANDDNRRSNSDLAHGEVAHSSYTDPSMDEDEKQPSPQSHTGDTKSSNTTQAKPEWKRYKQYTRDDIQRAIEAVKQGMSAVQAAKSFGVPSRTLYDKVKKLGIPTSRPFKRSSMQASNGGSAARFPYGIGGNVNGGIYSNSILSENENETSSSNVNIENLANSTSSASAFDTSYIKPASKDVSQDRDSISDSVTRYSPSPVIRYNTKQKQQQQSIDDEVEDLSVNRKPDVSGIMTSEAVKNEPQETGPSNSDCCDYS